VGDVDGDGFLDLLLTGFRRLALLHNVGGQRFADCTVAAGLDPNVGRYGYCADPAAIVSPNSYASDSMSPSTAMPCGDIPEWLVNNFPPCTDANVPGDNCLMTH
jgi:hypothetical protein